MLGSEPLLDDSLYKNHIERLKQVQLERMKSTYTENNGHPPSGDWINTEELITQIDRVANACMRIAAAGKIIAADYAGAGAAAGAAAAGKRGAAAGKIIAADYAGAGAAAGAAAAGKRGAAGKSGRNRRRGKSGRNRRRGKGDRKRRRDKSSGKSGAGAGAGAGAAGKSGRGRRGGRVVEGVVVGAVNEVDCV